MKVLLVDDEELARVEMRRLLSVHPEVSVVGEAATVDEALKLTADLRPEVVFLDIRLAGESGFDYVARTPDPAPHLVFVTAHDRYAVRGFECNAMDYLLKPVDAARLAESLRRIRDRRQPRPAAGENDPVFLKGASTGKFVPWSEISHIVAEGNYSRVMLADGTEPVVHRPLKDWLGITPKERFLQIHRGIIARLDAMRELRTTATGQRELVMKSGAALPVGRAYWGDLKDFL